MGDYVRLNTLHDPATGTSPPASWGDQIDLNFQQAIWGAWTSRTPTLSGATVTLGTGGTNLQRYARVGRSIFVVGTVTLGTGGDLTAGPLAINLPEAAVTVSGLKTFGVVQVFDTSASVYYQGLCELGSGASTISPRVYKDGSAVVGIGGTDPMDWAVGDYIAYALVYESATGA